MGKTSDVDAVARALRVARATFSKRTGDLEATIKNRIPACKKAKKQLRKWEERLVELGGELSEEVSSQGSLLGSTSSNDSSESSSDDAPADAKKAEAKPAVPARPTESESGKHGPDSVAKPKPASKKPARRSKEEYPCIPPGEPAPHHRGKPNAQDVLYPGFPTEDPRFCDTCEVLRRGFTRTGKSHRPDCEWRSRR